MNKIRQEYLDTFNKAYTELNPNQKKAVDQIEGPVMVVAGPGTGKTQLLAIRAGNILMQTDAYPQNILCLTFTEAGVIAMRNRLLDFIGPDAHNVQIHTFHGFCNMVILENPEQFGNYRDLQVISDLEEQDLYRRILDNLSDEHPLKRLKGNIYTDIDRLKNLFKTMKQENWTYESFAEAVEKRKSVITDKSHPDNPYIYKRRTPNKVTGTYFEAGDLKQSQIEEELEKYDRLLGAAALLAEYNKEMAAIERFDYADMILWVIEKFKANDLLLGKYQERYQYIMVDEYQDTNGAQNDILFLLASYWEDAPNVFIVGDDDQSIYRFQGANMNNILDFKERYHPVEVVLTDNFRSSQLILDRSKKLIDHNEERLVKKYDYLVKDLVEKRKPSKDDPAEPVFIRYENETQEEVAVIRKIKELHTNGTPYNDIAVIYRNHKHSENMVQYLMSKNIPINVKKRVNALAEPEIEKLLNILEYIFAEYQKPHSAHDRLFELMHYQYFGLHALDVARISVYCRHKDKPEDEAKPEQQIKTPWREVLADDKILLQAGVKDIQSVLSLSEKLESWIGDIPNNTVQTLIEKIITDGGILDAALKSREKSWKLQLLNTFFDFVKSEVSRKKTLRLKDLLSTINLMQESKLDLPLNRIISNQDGVHFLTAHGSKGLEFEHVFIIRANKNQWEGKRPNNSAFKFPPTILSSADENSEEDDRRLFYVAMTRAKHYLYISYSAGDDKEKETEQSRFISECIHSGSEIISYIVPEDDIIEYKAQLMRFRTGVPDFVDKGLIDKVLENFAMSTTNLNKYLQCRLSFYFDTILRVPKARNKVMGYGNAIHYALEKFFVDITGSSPKSYGSQDKLTGFYRVGMEKYRGDFTEAEFENYLKHGIEVLSDYYQENKEKWLTPRKYDLEYTVKLTHFEGVPITGKIDKIEVYEDNHAHVVDYKTGKYDSKKLKPPMGGPEDAGGDYWRQIVFYKLLLDNDKSGNYKMKQGYMDFVEKDDNGKYHKNGIDVGALETEIVGTQLKDAYENIMNHQFTPGCGKEDCNWCNFVNKNMSAAAFTQDENEDYDENGLLYNSESEILS